MKAVHLAGNVLIHSPHKKKSEILKSMRNCFDMDNN